MIYWEWEPKNFREITSHSYMLYYSVPSTIIMQPPSSALSSAIASGMYRIYNILPIWCQNKSNTSGEYLCLCHQNRLRNSRNYKNKGRKRSKERGIVFVHFKIDFRTHYPINFRIFNRTEGGCMHSLNCIPLHWVANRLISLQNRTYQHTRCDKTILRHGETFNACLSAGLVRFISIDQRTPSSSIDAHVVYGLFGERSHNCDCQSDTLRNVQWTKHSPLLHCNAFQDTV